MQYEFADSDGALIKRVGTRLTTQGLLLIVAGLGGVVYSIIKFGDKDPTEIWVYVIQSVVEIIIGVSLILSPSHFRKVADTQGEDISALMTGLSKLNVAFIVVWITLTLNLALDVLLLITGA